MLRSTVVRATGQSASKSPVRGWVAYLTIKTASEKFLTLRLLMRWSCRCFLKNQRTEMAIEHVADSIHAPLSARDDDL
jgi:hypothetical protein